jgi:ABC-type antimicrobial peptide transport system permease subunit
MVGRNAAIQFQGMEIGGTIRFGGRVWRVVGIFEAGKSGFDSELWADGDMVRQSFRRASYSSLVVRLSDPSQAATFAERIKAERRFYEDQSETLSRFIQILGLTLTVIFSIGAVIGATITMQSAVATRTAEIGTLRALGFQRRDILLAFLAEAVFLALVGGAIGLAFASAMQAFRASPSSPLALY